MSLTTKEQRKRQRQKENKWRTQALAPIGFTKMSELAKAAGVNDGILAGIAKGTRKPSDTVAAQLINAIYERNSQDGWTYGEAAIAFQTSFNLLRTHFSSKSQHSISPIYDKDVHKWCSHYLDQLDKLQKGCDEILHIAMLPSSSTECLLTALLKFLQSWEMKHDFDYFGKVKQKFEDHKPLIIRSAVRRGIDEGHYDLLRSIYTEIRHIAHLCGEFNLVQEMSDWLIEQATFRGDIQTEIKVKVTQVWMMTSFNTKGSLYEAQKLIRNINQVVRTSSFLSDVSPSDMDVVAILAELRLRLAIRLDKQCMRPLDQNKFKQILEESKRQLEQPNSFQSLSPRLRTRYLIPLDYQQGVYAYHLNDYQLAQLKFESIVNEANYIGWTRVEQAGYSWLATLFAGLGEREQCAKALDKVNVLYLRKRQLICQDIRARLMADDS
jgi:hypothetical protein